MKIKNGLNSKMKSCKKKIVWNVLGIIDSKAIWKFCVPTICGLHFDGASKTSCKKFVEKICDQWYLSVLLNECNYHNYGTLKGMKSSIYQTWCISLQKP